MLSFAALFKVTIGEDLHSARANHACCVPAVLQVH